MEECKWGEYGSSSNIYGEKSYSMCDEVDTKKDFHDGHYAAMDVQPIELIQEVLTPEQLKGYLIGQIIKYKMRAGHKKGESYQKDTDKLERYREWLLLVNAGLKIDPRI